MIIKDIQLFLLRIPLKKPFKTSLRRVDFLENLVIKVITDTGEVGYGEAPPTLVITGDILESIIGVIENNFKQLLLGREINNLEGLLHDLHAGAVGHTSAKAALDMALYDLYGKLYNAPLYKLLGGFRKELKTDLTISVNSPEEMVEDALAAVEAGFDTLKLKVGKDSVRDLARVKAIRKAVGPDVKLRLDANQGWNPKEAVRVIRQLEELDLDIELVEQPVKAQDFEGLKYVKDHVLTPIMADESLFSPRDCLRLLSMRACDLINIKLMKAGGIYRALQINAIAESYGVEAMLGSMMESKVAVTAAAHLAAAKKNITRLDLDTPSLLAQDPVEGGIGLNGPMIYLPEGPGLGIKEIDNLKGIAG